MLYIQMDTTRNVVISNGMDIKDFSTGIPTFPKNIALLRGFEEDERIHTRSQLNVIEGEVNILTYFEKQEKKKFRDLRFIDIDEVSHLDRFSDTELSELFFFGQMKRPLHSPFFYKVNNQYGYFECKDGFQHVYYHQTQDFYHVFAKKIKKILESRLFERRNFFKRKIEVPILRQELLQDFREVFSEGVVFSFEQEFFIDREYVIPIYLVEDKLKFLENKAYKTQDIIARLVYNELTKEYRIEKSRFFY